MKILLWQCFSIKLIPVVGNSSENRKTWVISTENKLYMSIPARFILDVIDHGYQQRLVFDNPFPMAITQISKNKIFSNNCTHAHTKWESRQRHFEMLCGFEHLDFSQCFHSSHLDSWCLAQYFNSLPVVTKD